jgi:hypothetical protein
LCFTLANILLFADSDRVTLQGTITDSSGRRVAGAHVGVVIEATGLRRAAQSGEDGAYTLAGLPYGRATLTVERPGFQSVEYRAVELPSGATLTRDVELHPAAQATTVEVRADATAVERHSAEIGGSIRPAQIDALPLNGRNWQGLLALVPGAINTGTGDARGIRFTGHGADDNNFRLDGVDATGVRNQVPRDDVRLAISLESIAEFRVRAGLYAAESGGTMAAQVEAVTRSGSNAWRGSAFDYLRNDKLDARSPFDPASIPPFRLNQFGASLGGPLVKDRTFFFAVYEGLAQRLGQTLTAYVPSAAYRARALAASPAVQPLVDAFPLATAATSSADIGQWSGPGSANNDQHSGMLRVDHRFSDSSTLYARFSTNRMTVHTPLGDTTGYLDSYNRVDETVTTGVVEYQRIFTPALLNEARVGINRVPYQSQYESSLLPSLKVTGFTTIRGSRQSLVASTTFTLADTLTWVRGRHMLKAGATARPLRFALRTIADGSTLTYTSVATLAANQMSTATLNGFLPTRGVSKTQWAAFVQDDFRLNSELTLSAGLRYDRFGVLAEQHGRAQVFDIPTCGGFCADGAPFTFADRNNVAPRLGLAWAPRHWGGSTVVRAGAGVFYGEGQLGNQTSPVENETTRISLTSAQLSAIPLADLLNPSYTNRPGTLTTAPLDLERQRKDMYTTQWSLSVQHSFAGLYLAEAGYTGSHGAQLFSRTYYNGVNPATGTRPYPAYGLIAVRANGGNSSFQSLIASLRRMERGGLSLGANYMWSHAIDEYSAGGDDASYPQNVNCRACERASGDFDIRHTFNVNAVYALPYARARRWSALLSGWRLTGLATARTGRAITATVSRAASALPDQNVTSAQRPDVVSGVNLYASPRTPAKWLNLAAFSVPAAGTWGNAGRNLARGPAIWNIDTAIGRRLRVSERLSADVRAEVFNVLNHPQFANPAASISSAATYGVISQMINTGSTGTGTPRQMEFMLRLSF